MTLKVRHNVVAHRVLAVTFGSCDLLVVLSPPRADLRRTDRSFSVLVFIKSVHFSRLVLERFFNLSSLLVRDFAKRILPSFLHQWIFF